LCAATQTEHQLASTIPDLREMLRSPARGIRVIELRTDRTLRRDFDTRLREGVAHALGS
jgi:2-succinyl-5-enolpyruvyl-6-hydroxy-3-cyclohexene-1-carboxylate synthase